MRLRVLCTVDGHRSNSTMPYHSGPRFVRTRRRRYVPLWRAGPAAGLIKEKICSWAALARRLKADRRRGRSIVFTNGCFDVLHVGHLKVLVECKKQGDVLVLGLNSDA